MNLKSFFTFNIVLLFFCIFVSTNIFFEASLSLFFCIFSGLHNNTFSTTKLTYSTVKLKQQTVVQGQASFQKT